MNSQASILVNNEAYIFDGQTLVRSALLPTEKTAVIQPAQVSIEIVKVGSKQLTQSVFRQIPEGSFIQDGKILPSLWGKVRYFFGDFKDEDGYHVLFEREGKLYRDWILEKSILPVAAEHDDHAIYALLSFRDKNLSLWEDEFQDFIGYRKYIDNEIQSHHLVDVILYNREDDGETSRYNLEADGGGSCKALKTKFGVWRFNCYHDDEDKGKDRPNRIMQRFSKFKANFSRPQKSHSLTDNSFDCLELMDALDSLPQLFIAV